jgi:hypothetical protein
MRIFAMALVLVFMAGCHTSLGYLENDDIIQETKKCQEAGMTPKYYHMDRDENKPVFAVQCEAK